MSETEILVNGRPFKGKNLIGQRFGSLVVVRLDHLRPHKQSKPSAMWFCHCDCGEPNCKGSKIAYGGLLKNGKTVSCGALNKRKGKQYRLTHGFNKKGQTHPFYDCWRGVLKRCLKPKTKGYHNYGGRGITVCDRWLVFENFRDDMFALWKPRLTLERKDNNGPYSPENCIFATYKTQSRNRRNNHMVTAFGKTLCLTDWAELCGLGENTLRARIKVGWNPEEAFTTPSNKEHRSKSYKPDWLKNFLAQTP